ncbi:cytochrome c [Pelagibacterium limicola]|uniref:cytochrome c n=1 Tax=Pelagibacterium limicola TaxID=2791022 RepID=UPI0018AF5D92|nr:cytochrome c [Pelagibacterium limicola]
MTDGNPNIPAIGVVAFVAALGGTDIIAQELNYTQIERGRYLATAGNCVACHTDIENDGIPFAGGRGLETPFGIIYSQNLTPDDETGIGHWTRDDFYRAMNEGVDRHGEHLYPAFPYVYFTIVTREDVDAIYEYLRTLEPVQSVVPENELPFPLDVRQSLLGWKTLFFEEAEFVPDPDQSEVWNRGRYLVDGLGHCGACHTGKNALGGDQEDEYLRGGTLENWYAPNIRGGLNGGISHWEIEDIVDFLGVGRARHTAPMQRMGEVVGLSTQYLTEGDLEAIAVYLKSLDDRAPEVPDPVDEDRYQAGKAIYFDNCAACHAADGSGVPYIFAPLDGSNKVTAEDPSTMLRVILGGAKAEPTDLAPGPLAMPPFAWKLTDEQIADLASYMRQAWSNSAGAISPDAVADMRAYLEEHR